jgi:hypothetical protein|tara:strand:- start:79 stop:441 length:363 start_codon:yes stop_codon:yes gene_type:complete
MPLKTIQLNCSPLKNTSIQIEDIAYYVENITDDATANLSIKSSDKDPKKLGPIKNILSHSIIVETDDINFAIGDFVMFSKDKSVNNSSLLGYYAEIKLANNSTEKAELFSIGSEITQSSK